MVLKIFVVVLFVQTLQNGVCSSISTKEPNKCNQLIQEVGQMACSMTGQGDYKWTSIANCWVVCTAGDQYLFIPNVECERTLNIDFWAAYQQLNNGDLPPYKLESPAMASQQTQSHAESPATEWPCVAFTCRGKREFWRFSQAVGPLRATRTSLQALMDKWEGEAWCTYGTEPQTAGR